MELTGYQHATVGSIMAELPAGLSKRFSDLTFTAHGQRLQTNDLLIEKGVQSLDTVRVGARLPGGSKANEGEA